MSAQATPAKIRVKRITFTRAEGRSDGLDGTGREHDVVTFALINAIIFTMRARLPDNYLGYAKCDFKIEWEDGETYEGRYDLGHDTDAGTLDEHVRRHCEFYAGRWCPPHMSEEQYRKFLACEHIARSDYAKFLDTYQIGDAP